MLSSKKKNSLFAGVVLASILMLTGCLNPDKKTAGEQDATAAQASFYISSVANPEVQPPTHDRVWNLPTAANYKFKACLINRVTRAPIIARKFQVLAEKKTYSVVTDGQGCIEWTESIPYNFFAPKPKYLVFERTIRGMGLDGGNAKLEFALDPWKATRGGEHAEFIYLRTPDLVKPEMTIRGETNVFRAQNDVQQHKLQVNGLVVDIMQKKQLSDGIQLSMALEMTPGVRLEKMNGHVTEVNFFKGRFDVYASIIATNLGAGQNQNYRVTPFLHQENVSMQDGELRFTFKEFDLKTVNTDGNLILALKVVPLGQEEGLSSFATTYRLGSYNQWLGMKRPLQQSDSIDLGMNYDQLVNSAIDATKMGETGTLENSFTKVEPFKFSYMVIKYNGIKAGETATTRTVAFDVKTCVTNFTNGTPVVSKKFQIVRRKIKDPELMKSVRAELKAPIEKYTDEFGCFAWIDEVTHKYYKPEHYVVSGVELTDPVSGFQKTVEIAINPWDLFATFGKDLRDVEKSDNRFRPQDPNLPPERIESRFNIADFGYTAIRFDYDIRKDLRLNVKKSVLLKLHPEVQRFSSITGGRMATERLRDGIWLLKIAIQKDYLDPATKGAIIDRSEDGKPNFRLDDDHDARERQYISFQEKLVRVINGRVITPVEFEMRDLRLMRIRSNMLVQLEPIDETKLQFANIYKEHLDAVSKIRERMEPTIDQLAIDREGITPDAEKRGSIDVSGMTPEQRAAKEQSMSIEERRQYYNDRMGLIENFIERLDSNQLRTAIHEGNITQLNSLVHDASKYDEQGYPLSSAVGDVPSNFKSTGGIPIDAGLLDSLSDQMELTATELSRLKLNDFTVEPAAPILSLDFLKEDFETSGLRKRTFVGPVTFLFNSNGSEVRATDTLDEVFCLNNTCDTSTVTAQQLKEWTFAPGTPYEWKKFYGWVAHFFNKHVDDLIYTKRGGERKYLDENGVEQTEKIMGLDEIYDREMKARSLISNFVNQYNLTYVSLDNKPMQTVAKDCPFLYYDESCLVDSTENTMSFDKYLADINSASLFVDPPPGTFEPIKIDPTNPGRAGLDDRFSPDGRPILPADFYGHVAQSGVREVPATKEDIYKLISEEKAVGLLAERICANMVNNLTGKFAQIGMLGPSQAYNFWQELLTECVQHHVDEKNTVISIEPRYKVFETGRIKFKGGKSLNVNVNQSFALSNKESQGFKLSYDFTGPLRLIPIIGDFLAGMGLQIGKDTSRDKNVGTSIVQGAFLVVQMANFDIELTKYERCVVLGFKQDAVINRLRASGMNVNVDQDLVAQAISSGVMLCNGGEPEAKPIAVRERYYYVTQHFTEGDMLDSGDLFNHPWLLAIRGVRDFDTFMLALHGDSHALPVNAFEVLWDVASGAADGQTKIKEYTWPLDQLVKSYMYIRPTFPGLYSHSNHSVKQFDWESSPEESFEEDGYGLGKPQVNDAPQVPEGLVNTLKK